jgi:uncharacterized OB-fold protein
MASESRAGPDAVYASHLAQGRFMIQRCVDCAMHVFMPRLLCTGCGSAALEWVQPSGHGVVYSATTVRQRADKGGDYNVSLIDLAEGPRLMSRVEGLAPDEVRIGQAVRACVTRDERGAALLVFQPVEERS